MKPEPENSGNGPKRGRPRALLIAGPTASGKSALALTLARKLGGEIVNADSMQVYSILRVLTARPTADDEVLVPHHLYGVFDPSEVCSAQAWAEMALAKVEEIEARGGFPILVGGTGLYFKALTAGLSPMPPVPADIRAAVREEVAADAGATHAALEKVDPEAAARIGPADGQRIARALEIHRATGKPLTWWQGHAPEPLLTGDLLKFVLDPPRDWLRARIDTRFDLMIGEGALDEVRALAARQLDPALPAMKALGVPSLMAHLAGEKSLEEAIAEAKTLTKQFAKRQSTWFRHQMIAWERLSAQEMESQIQEIFSFIDDYGLTAPH